MLPGRLGDPALAGSRDLFDAAPGQVPGPDRGGTHSIICVRVKALQPVRIGAPIRRASIPIGAEIAPIPRIRIRRPRRAIGRVAVSLVACPCRRSSSEHPDR